VSRLCADERVTERPLEGDWPCLWIEATYLKVRQNGRIVSVAVIVAVDVNTDGRREVLGIDIGPSEAEPFWMAFLRKLARRGLRRGSHRRIAPVNRPAATATRSVRKLRPRNRDLPRA